MSAGRGRARAAPSRARSRGTPRPPTAAMSARVAGSGANAGSRASDASATCMARVTAPSVSASAANGMRESPSRRNASRPRSRATTRALRDPGRNRWSIAATSVPPDDSKRAVASSSGVLGKCARVVRKRAISASGCSPRLEAAIELHDRHVAKDERRVALLHTRQPRHRQTRQAPAPTQSTTQRTPAPSSAPPRATTSPSSRRNAASSSPSPLALGPWPLTRA